jgi:hypothetical protein
MFTSVRISTLSLVPVLLSAFVTAACGSGATSGTASPSDDSGGAGGAGGAGGDMSATGGAPSNPQADAAPGELVDLELSVTGDQYEFSWSLPKDADLKSLGVVILPAEAAAPAVEDTDALDLAQTSVVMSGLETGTDYVAYFALTDEGGHTTLTTKAFSTAGAPPVNDVVALGLKGAVYLRWKNPASGFDAVTVRSAPLLPPLTLTEGEEAYLGTADRAIAASLAGSDPFGFMVATLDGANVPSTIRTVTLAPNADHGVVVDASAECDVEGYKIGEAPYRQTFVRGAAGEDVLTALELEFGVTGSPTDRIGVMILDKNDQYLWSNSVLANTLTSGVNWVSFAANGKGIKSVPYELLEPGETYTIEVKVTQWGGSHLNYVSWRASSAECYGSGESSVGSSVDFHFRTVMAKAP